MNFYYGLVDQATCAWGFLEEIDKRVRPGMIYLENAEWRQLLNEQSQGRQIVCWDGKVFTSEPGRYWVDMDGWHKKTDAEFNAEKAQEKREFLVNKCYEIKAGKAYGGVVINELLVFETNQTAITNTVASLALMGDEDTSSWKFYTVTGNPSVQVVTKAQLAGIAKFAQNMINQSFQVEGVATNAIAEATEEQLLNDEWIENFIQQVQTNMDAISNQITIAF